MLPLTFLGVSRVILHERTPPPCSKQRSWESKRQARARGMKLGPFVLAALWSVPTLSCSSTAPKACGRALMRGQGAAAAAALPLACLRSGGRAAGLLRLRGAGDVMDAPVVDTRPPVAQLPDDFDAAKACPEGEEKLAAAEQALLQGRFEDARCLQQDAVQRFSARLLTSKYYDTLWDLWDRIGRAEDLQRQIEATSKAPRPAYWSVSPSLNLTKEQVAAVETWVGRPLEVKMELCDDMCMRA